MTMRSTPSAAQRFANGTRARSEQTADEYPEAGGVCDEVPGREAQKNPGRSRESQGESNTLKRQKVSVQPGPANKLHRAEVQVKISGQYGLNVTRFGVLIHRLA